MAEKEKMGEQLIINETELTRKNQLLDKTKDMDNKQLSKAISREQKTAKITKDYAKLFYEIRPEFYEWLTQQAAPNKLTGTELKYCAYISLRMNGKDLSNVMNVEYSTVATHKQNLKKKLHLARKDRLDEFILKFTPPPLTIINIYLLNIPCLCYNYNLKSVSKKLLADLRSAFFHLLFKIPYSAIQRTGLPCT